MEIGRASEKLMRAFLAPGLLFIRIINFVFCVCLCCSPYFQRIFCETPCKHPVIVLKDLKGWEMQAIVDFMYKGEISVGHEQLASLMNAAESLQV